MSSFSLPADARVAGADRTSSAFTVLVVCAANQCRSPAMASVLNQGVGNLPGLASSDVRVVSAGTMDTLGVRVHPRTARALKRKGYVAPDTVSRSISRDLVAQADLVLTASRRHRSQVVRLVPDALTRTYTLREFARYCEQVAPARRDPVAKSAAARLRAVMDQAAQLRGMTVPSRAEEDDIADPAGGSRRAHSRTIRQVKAAVGPVLTAIHPDAAPPARRRSAAPTARPTAY